VTQRKGPLYAMAFGNFAVGIGALVVAGVLQPLADTFTVSLSTVGLLVTVYAFTYAAGSPLIIIFTSAAERRVLLAVGLAAVAAGNLLVAAAPVYGLIVAGRVVTAVGAATFTPVASAVAAHISPPAERGRAIALVFAGFTAATALGVPFGTYLGLVVGWRLTFAAVALLAVLAVAFVAVFVPRRVDAPPADIRVFARALRQPLLMATLAVTLVQMAAQLSVFTYVAPYVQERVAVGAVGITLLFLANGAAGFAGNLGGGRLADRIGTGRTIALFLGVLVAALAVLPVVGRSLLVGAVAIAVWGYVGLGFNAPQQAHLVGLAPELANAVLALNASFLYLGISLGSFLGGQVVDAGQIRNLHWLAVGLALTAAVIFAVTRTRFPVAKIGGRP
jgi:MFS transporter, DHA1 family, inner membrane transport protein